jgi:CheY-like chemotaxis protein
MVIDDDEIACEHTLGVLQAIGIESDTMCDSEEGLDLIRTAYDNGQPYGLIITDYKMPGMNGLSLTKAVREFDHGKAGVIMLTGYNWDIIEEDAREAGIDDIMAKPLFSDTLSRKIYHVFRAKEGTEYDVSQSDETIEERTNNLAGCMILMAEDVDQNAEILEDLLDLEDINSERAENGARALEMFTEKPVGYYDAILMDVRMPVMDGLESTKAIRALDRPDAKTIPIIAMTANVFDEDVERSLQAGMNAHLSKPIEPEYLYETMERLIKG